MRIQENARKIDLFKQRVEERLREAAIINCNMSKRKPLYTLNSEPQKVAMQRQMLPDDYYKGLFAPAPALIKSIPKKKIKNNVGTY